VQRGNTVEWFAASFAGAQPEELMEGIRIVRSGEQWSVHFRAFRRYRRQISSAFDVVIDQTNTIPFFTPLWATVPSVMLIHQLAREVWWYEAPPPLNLVGYVAEPIYLKIYRRRPVLTVSASTRTDLLSLGFTNRITIVQEGIDPIAKRDYPKRAEPSFIYVGRLARSKRVEHILIALARMRKVTGSGTLQLVGSGPPSYADALMETAKQLGISDYVTFCGRVPQAEKHRLMGESHALLMTSVREGWGLVVTEASACGTPSIVYDVPGLRDSVRNEVTGLVVQPTPDRLAAAMQRIVTDQVMYSHLVAEGLRWSQSFSFDTSADQFDAALRAALSA